MPTLTCFLMQNQVHAKLHRLMQRTTFARLHRGDCDLHFDSPQHAFSSHRLALLPHLNRVSKGRFSAADRFSATTGYFSSCGNRNAPRPTKKASKLCPLGSKSDLVEVGRKCRLKITNKTHTCVNKHLSEQSAVLRSEWLLGWNHNRSGKNKDTLLS